MNQSNLIQCQNNINTLAHAIDNYTKDHFKPPMFFKANLQAYVQKNSTFFCPETGDFYGNYFLNRKSNDKMMYYLGCPNHNQQQILYRPSDQKAFVCHSAEFFADGGPVEPGIEVEPGQSNSTNSRQIQFECGSVVKVPGGSIFVLASYQLDDDPYTYTILRLLEKNSDQKISIVSSKTSKMLVKTPASIIKVDGKSEFELKTIKSLYTQSTHIKVNSGSIFVILPNEQQESLIRGESATMTSHINQVQKDPFYISKRFRDGITYRENLDDLQNKKTFRGYEPSPPSSSAKNTLDPLPDKHMAKSEKNKPDKKGGKSFHISQNDRLHLTEFKYRFTRQ